MVKINRFNKYKYPEPERFSPTEARERRLTAMLERERRFAEVPGFMPKLDALSQARKKTVNLSRTIVNEDKANLHKAASIAAALAQFSERDFVDPQKRAAYRALRARQEGLRNVQAKPVDARQFNPTGKGGFASTIYGTIPKFGAVHARGPRVGWLPNFHVPTSVVPCIQRAVRREVMFALDLAGRGYRTKKKRNENSGVPC